MNSFNSPKLTFIVAIATVILTAYSLYFDLYLLKIPYSHVLVSIKIALSVSSIAMFASFKKENLDLKVFIFGILCATYSIYFIYFYSINYMLASIQLLMAYIGILYLDRLYYFILYCYLSIGTYLAMNYSVGKYGFSALDQYYKRIYIDDFTNLQLFTGVVYIVVTYPRIKKIKEELSFSNFGKASSFILHEIHKPISRMHSNDVKNEEVNYVFKTLELAKKIQQSSLDNYQVESVSLKSILTEIQVQYKDYINFLSIQVAEDVLDITIQSNREMLTLIIDNIFKNAIEANKELPDNQRWINCFYKEKVFTIENSYDNMISETDLFIPLKSSKSGNMGIGLYFCKMISNSLGYQLNVKCKNKIFQMNLHFQG